MGLPTPTPFAPSKRRIAASFFFHSLFSQRGSHQGCKFSSLSGTHFQASIPFTRCGKPVWGLTERGRRAGELLGVPIRVASLFSPTHAALPAQDASLPDGRGFFAGQEEPSSGGDSPLRRERPASCALVLPTSIPGLVSCAPCFPATVLLYLGRISFTPDLHLGRLWFVCFLFSLNKSQSLSWLLLGGFAFL